MALRLKSELATAWARRRLRKYVDKRLRESHATVRTVEVKVHILTAVIASAVLCEILVVVYFCWSSQGGHRDDISAPRPKREVVVGTPSLSESSVVEFVDPKLRSEFDEKEKQNNSRDSGTNPWVWPTSYSRVPVNFD